MANYPNYLTNVPSYPNPAMGQPMYNNGFNQPGMPSNPYLDRMAQLQQYQQSLQQPTLNTPTQPMATPIGINGKIVQSVETITANDVPMDGSVAVFPRQDLTEIYIKSWNGDGTIRTVVYKPVVEPQSLAEGKLSSEAENFKISLLDEATAAFMKRFDEIENRFDKLEKTMGGGKPVSKAKKETDE